MNIFYIFISFKMSTKYLLLIKLISFIEKTFYVHIFLYF